MTITVTVMYVMRICTNARRDSAGSKSTPLGMCSFIGTPGVLPSQPQHTCPWAVNLSRGDCRWECIRPPKCLPVSAPAMFVSPLSGEIETSMVPLFLQVAPDSRTFLPAYLGHSQNIPLA